MRYTLLATTLLFANAAFAQEAPYSRTLNEQLQRTQQGQQAQPPQGNGAQPTQWSAPQDTMMHHTMTQTGPVDSVGSGAIPALPLAVQQSGDVRYLTGGVGDEELAELKSMQKQFNVQLLLTGTDGDYMSEVQAKITDKSGNEVLSAPSVGPYLYVALKPGSYNVELTSAKGEHKTVKITAPAKGGAAKSQVHFSS